ncbi:MAG: VWA domain-containing protein [Flavobacteriales bacterium]|nr:VWA domain-containing protein [Flavobacteriales bacterium]
MRVVVLLFVLLSVTLVSKGQIEFGDNPFDLGVITSAGTDFVDIPVTNNGNEKIFIFRIDADKRFQIHYSSKTIFPDSTVYIRILYTPDKKGFFSEKLPIHFSHLTEPFILKVEGFCEEIPKSDLITCPSFDQQNINTSLENDFTVMVVDESTNEPIEDAEVIFVQNGVKTQTITTNKKGLYTKKQELGYYYFIASHNDYNPNEVGTYINRKNNLVIIPLSRKEISEVAPDEVPEIIEDDSAIINNNATEETNDVIVEEIEVENYIEQYPAFPLADYKPNNIVFLLDVSSSMNMAGKIDLLKASMIELTRILRPIDKITLVAYASSANVIMETTSVEDVDTLITIIQDLKPKGMTAGGKGMNLAYSKACNAFIPDGNNQIIMATDGAFNMGEENVNKLAKKFNKKGVTVSVIGIKNRDIHQESMRKLSEDGGGNYININNFEEAQKTLVEEIKSQSRRK